MSWESPWAWGMLLALLWPLWLHLQRRRGVRVHNFAFARLLQQSSSPQQKRWRRWQQIPFMLLRLAAIALLVGSGAGPTWPRDAAWGDGQAGALAIVVDDSFSMRRRDADGVPLCVRAWRQARAAAAAAAPGSELSVVWAGKPARLAAGPTQARAPILAALGNAPPRCLRRRDSARAKELASAGLLRSSWARRRLLWLGDNAGVPDDQSLAQGVTWWQPRLLRPDAPTANAAILRFDSKHIGEERRFEAEIDARGTLPRQVRLSLHRWGQDKALHSELHALPAGQPETLRWTLPAADVAASAWQLRLHLDDDVPEDNTRVCLRAAPPMTRIIVVEGDPEDGIAQAELWQQALQAFSGRKPRLSRITQAELRAPLLRQAGLLLWANKAAPDSAMAERIAAFVRRGGGLWLAWGGEMHPGEMPAAWRRLLPVTVLGRQEGRHRIRAAAEPSWALFLKNSRIESRALARLRAGARKLLAFDDGKPALAQHRIGRGRVAWLALPLVPSWSDLPYQPGFVPMVGNLVEALRPPSPLHPAAPAPGEAVRLRLPPDLRALDLETPSATRSPQVTGGNRRHTLPGQWDFGPYTLHVQHARGGTQQWHFVLNPPAEESQSIIRPATRRVSARPAGQAHTVPPRTAGAPERLAPWLALLALLALTVEGLYAAYLASVSPSAAPRQRAAR